MFAKRLGGNPRPGVSCQAHWIEETGDGGQHVKLTFGSDAHCLYEVGDFAMVLDLLARIGMTAIRPTSF